MQRLRVRIWPRTAFATPLKGDTLFGQLCWILRERHGEARLDTLLEGYTQGRPFLAVSDAFPGGYLPRPQLPAELLGFDMREAKNRKAAKGLRWLPIDALEIPLEQWHRVLVADKEAKLGWRESEQHHNTLNRITGTTGTGQFAPYSSAVTHYTSETRLDIYLALDADRLDQESTIAALEHCGQTGFGKDASIGLGKFEIENVEALPENRSARRWLTLAPSLPSDTRLDHAHCYYATLTRFSKHGSLAVLTGRPFKNPLVLADSGALLTFETPLALDVIGHGLGGEGRLSRAIAATVHQGYSPVVPIRDASQSGVGQDKEA